MQSHPAGRDGLAHRIIRKFYIFCQSLSYYHSTHTGHQNGQKIRSTSLGRIYEIVLLRIIINSLLLVVSLDSEARR